MLVAWVHSVHVYARTCRTVAAVSFSVTLQRKYAGTMSDRARCFTGRWWPDLSAQACDMHVAYVSEESATGNTADACTKAAATRQLIKCTQSQCI